MARKWFARFALPGLSILVILSMAGCTVAVLATGGTVTPAPGVSPLTPPQAQATIQVSPALGGPETLLTVSGAGFPADADVTISIGSATTGVEPQTYAVFKADANGQFSASFVLSSTWPDGTPIPQADLIILAAAQGTNVQASTTFHYVPSGAVPVPAATSTLTTTQTTTVTPTATTAATLAATVAAPTVTPLPSDMGRVLSAYLNLRKGPGTAYMPIGALPAGTTFTVLGQNATGLWLYIVLANGQAGWVYGPYTDFQGTAPYVVAPPLPSYPTATPASAFPDWKGEYFNNRYLSGSPVLTRDDVNINFNWDAGSPAPGLPNTNYSVRWTRSWTFSNDGTYRFHAVVDDGVRLWVDGNLVIDQWQDGSQREVTGDIWLGAGTHSLQVEYYQNAGSAVIDVWWEQVSSYPDWKGEYFNNRYLSGSPVLTRDDVNINFNWDAGSPAPGLPNTNYSVRWTRSWTFSNDGTYRFHAVVDDGVRLWVDGNLVIDQWQDGSQREVTGDIWLGAGTHSLQVEYYQNAGTPSSTCGGNRYRPPPPAIPIGRASITTTWPWPAAQK